MLVASSITLVAYLYSRKRNEKLKFQLLLREMEEKKILFEEENILDSPDIPISFSSSLLELIEQMKECDCSNNFKIWPKDSNDVYRSITVDYGRSHYFFTEDCLDIPRQVHEYCYRNYGNVDDENRKLFLVELGINSDPKILDNTTPTRNNLITRVKFELLKNYFNGKGIQDYDQMALVGMHYTTQNPLRWIKTKAIRKIEELYPDQANKLRFPFVKINFTVEENIPVLNIKMRNYCPKKGCWQVICNYPEDNQRKLEINFHINLREIPTNRGRYVVSAKGIYPIEKPDIKERYGIYCASPKNTIRYKDTTPTW
jgi:hypothetical protein